MNKQLAQRINEQFERFDRAILATCGQAGPQISHVRFEAKAQVLLIYLPQGSDHLFNLETDAEVVLLSATWKLHGRGTVISDTSLFFGQLWEVTVQIDPVQLHLLSDDCLNVIETFDF